MRREPATLIMAPLETQCSVSVCECCARSRLFGGQAACLHLIDPVTFTKPATIYQHVCPHSARLKRTDTNPPEPTLGDPAAPATHH